jgi:hypothetical protein
MCVQLKAGVFSRRETYQGKSQDPVARIAFASVPLELVNSMDDRNSQCYFPTSGLGVPANPLGIIDSRCISRVGTR